MGNFHLAIHFATGKFLLAIQSDIAMIRIILVLSLLKLAIPSKIPIHKQIVGPGGENIDVNIQVDIDVSDDDTTGRVYPMSTPGPRASCIKTGDGCEPTDGNDNKRAKKCCEGSTCVAAKGLRIFYCKETPEAGCKKTGYCTGDHECCDGLSCLESGHKIDPPFYSCTNASTPTEPTCLKTGETCAPSASKKCCPTNMCDLDNLKCVRVQERTA